MASPMVVKGELFPKDKGKTYFSLKMSYQKQKLPISILFFVEWYSL